MRKAGDVPEFFRCSLDLDALLVELVTKESKPCPAAGGREDVAVGAVQGLVVFFPAINASAAEAKVVFISLQGLATSLSKKRSRLEILV